MNLKDYLNYLILLGKIILKILLVLIAITSPLLAQGELDSNQTVQTKDSTFVMTKSPWGAVGRSALIPGWGQYYNEAYWKIPIIWGFMGWFTYLYIENNKLYKKYGDLYKESLKDFPNGDPNYKLARDTYRNDRDQWALILGLTYFLNLVDAYVDAQLFDFSVSENKYYRSPQLNVKLFIN